MHSLPSTRSLALRVVGRFIPVYCSSVFLRSVRTTTCRFQLCVCVPFGTGFTQILGDILPYQETQTIIANVTHCFSSNMPNPTLLFRSHALCFLSSQSFPPPHPFLFPPPYFLSPHKWGQWHKFLPSFLPSLSLPPPHFPSPPSVKVRILPSCIPHHCTTSRLCADVPLWYSTARWRRRNNRRSHACTYAFAQENKHTCEWTRARRIANLTVCVFVKLKRRKSKLGKSKSVHY